MSYTVVNNATSGDFSFFFLLNFDEDKIYKIASSLLRDQ